MYTSILLTKRDVKEAIRRYAEEITGIAVKGQSLKAVTLLDSGSALALLDVTPDGSTTA